MLRGSLDTPLNKLNLLLYVQSTPAAFAISMHIAEHCVPISKIAIAIIGIVFTRTRHTQSIVFYVAILIGISYNVLYIMVASIICLALCSSQGEDFIWEGEFRTNKV